MRQIKIKQVDVFAQAPFSGSPVAIIPDADNLSTEEMQNIAKETFLPRTAFITRGPDSLDKKARSQARFFTPVREIDTSERLGIAIFHILAEEAKLFLTEPVTNTILETNEGPRAVEFHLEEGKTKKIMVEQKPPQHISIDSQQDEIAQALGLSGDEIESAKRPIEIVDVGLRHLIVPVKGINSIKKAAPNLRLLSQLLDSSGVSSVHLFTLEASSPMSMASARSFSPWLGTIEDPAVGNGNGALGAYLIKNKVIRGNSPITMLLEQGHAVNRPSEITVEVLFSLEQVNQIRVGGLATTVREGEIII